MIWIGNKKFPNESNTFLKTWSRKNVDYTTVLWTNEESDKLMSDSKLAKFYFESRNIGFKSDLLRYEILRSHGGVYVDSDLECLRPINSLVNNASFTYADQANAEPAIGFLASVKDGKFINYLINILTNHIENGIHKEDVFHRTLEMSGPYLFGCSLKLWFGPNRLSPIYDNYGYHIGNKLKDTAALYEWTVYPYNPCCADKEYNASKHAAAYAIHHWNASWA